MKSTLLKRAFAALAVCGLLTSIGCAADAGGAAPAGTAPEATAARAPHWEALRPEDPIENLQTIEPGEAKPELTCKAPMIECGYCEGYMFCTTFIACEKICGDRG